MASGFKLEVDLRGFKEFSEKLEFAPDILMDVKKQMLEKGAEIAQAKAKEKSPVDNGPLRASISNKVSTDVARVGTNLDYGVYMEFGTGIYSEYPGASKKPILPKRGKFLVFKPKGSKGQYVTSGSGRQYYKPGSGNLVFAKKIRGSKPHFFMKAGFEEVERNLDKILDIGRSIVQKLSF